MNVIKVKILVISQLPSVSLPDLGHPLEMLSEEGGDAAGVEPARGRHPVALALQVELGRAASKIQRYSDYVTNVVVT